ncbi:hypothetical protein AAG906_016372 [Vitis piasezkii]
MPLANSSQSSNPKKSSGWPRASNIAPPPLSGPCSTSDSDSGATVKSLVDGSSYLDPIFRITMEEISLSSEQVPSGEGNETEKERDGEKTELVVQNGLTQGRKEFVSPAVGMEFESYDDAYNYYNCYAKEETRTGCPAMIRMRLVDSKRCKIYKSMKKMGSGTKRKLQSNSDAEVRTIKLYRALVIDAGVDESNFFYLMDLNDEGCLRNVFWIDARSLNHHGQSVLLGCGLLAGETSESYVWLFKAWVTCMSGRTPQTIITDRCKALQNAIAEVFPRSHHRFGLSHIMKKVPEKLGGLRNYDAIRKALIKAVYESLKVIEFESAWGFLIQRFAVSDHEWLRSLFEDRARWAPVYLKDTHFAGMSSSQPGETLNPFFDRYVHKQTPLKEFLDKYELALQKKHKEEALADIESRNSGPTLKTRCFFELQLSKVYTREIFKKFQFEVEEMYSCFSTTQLHVDGPIIIFLEEIRDFEVLYNRAAAEVRCICSCFNFYGYLCRHALCVLNFNGVEEIPSKYILSRWKKDYKRLYIPDHVSNNVDGTDRVQWFNQLYRSALQVVEEGAISLDHYKIALQAFDESLNRVHNVEEKPEQLKI